MEEQNFLTISDQYLENLAESIEKADKDVLLNIEYHDGVLEIESDKKGVYVINRHGASKKIWFSSPFSGADYFLLKMIAG